MKINCSEFWGGGVRAIGSRVHLENLIIGTLMPDKKEACW